MARGRTVTFADGTSSEFDVVVWATGFTTNHAWIDVPRVKDERGRIVHKHGVTTAPGLYVLGLTWQHTRGSALLGWVGSDAAFIADQLSLHIDQDPDSSHANPSKSPPHH